MMRPYRVPTWLFFAFALISALAATRHASAYPTGIYNPGVPPVSWSGCNSCHTGGGPGGNTAVVSFNVISGGNPVAVGGATYVDANTDVTIDFHVTPNYHAWVGFNVAENGPDVGLLKSGSGIVHQICSDLSTPSPPGCSASTTQVSHTIKQDIGAGGTASFRFVWHSPNKNCADSILYGWGNTIVNQTTDDYTKNFAIRTSINLKTRCGNGTGCGSSSICISGSCVDGNCCNRACAGACETCAGTGGTCSFTTGLTRTSASCGGTGSCVGSCSGSSSNCSFPGATTTCSSPTCDTVSDKATPASLCNGGGGCTPQAQINCAPSTCNVAKTACNSGCSGDGDCIAAYYCLGAACTPKNPLGTACTGANQCASGFCIDGVCCNTNCPEQCGSCNLAATKGTCSAVTGAPVGGRPPCLTDGTACGGACDGATLALCAYPSTSCRTGNCSSGVATLPASCDGKGNCPLPKVQVCTPFGCNAASTACNATCAIDGDCSAGYFCDAGACVPRSIVGASCAGDKECTTGFCVDGVCCDRACNSQCEACDVKLGTCLTITGPPHGARKACGDSDGCPTTCDGSDPANCTPAACDAGPADTGLITPDTAVDDTAVAPDSGPPDGGGTDGGAPDGARADAAGDASTADGGGGEGGADGGDDGLNENGDCACRTTGRSNAATDGLVFLFGAAAFALRRRRQRTG